MTQTYTRRKHSVTHCDPIQTHSGFTLISPFGTDDAWLIDMKGRFVHHWEMPGFSCKLLQDGHLLGITDKGLLELDWDGKAVWRHEDKSAGKDFHRLQNGNTLYLRRIPVPADIAGRVKGGISGTDKEGMFEDALIEVNPSGKVVWEWLAHEHLNPEEDAICQVCYRDQWTDGDSCSMLDDGNILICLSRTHNLYIIEKATGKIKWQWGVKELAHPHHATMLDNGNILVFDSGLHPYGVMPGGFSRLIEIDPRENKMVWEYKGAAALFFYSTFMGSCQRLPDGNTLVTESQTGRVFEITDNNEIVWEYINPFYNGHSLYGQNNILFRAYRYGVEDESVQGRVMDASSKVEWANKTYWLKILTG